MDTSRMHVVADINAVPELERSRYTAVPDHLRSDAELALAGKQHAYASPSTTPRLTQWAERYEKKKKQNRARAKAARASRKKNR